MDASDKLFETLNRIQVDISEVKASLGVLVSKQEEVQLKLDRGTEVMDKYAIRLRHIESKLEKHAGYFTILGTGLLACIGGLITLYAG